MEHRGGEHRVGTWHRCGRWRRFGFRCPFGGRYPEAQLRPPEKRKDDEEGGDDDDNGWPLPGAPERRLKKGLRATRDVMDLVNEVLEAMAVREALRPVEQPVKALARAGMVRGMLSVREGGSLMSAGAVEAALASFAAERVREVIVRARTPRRRGGESFALGVKAVTIGAGVAGGGFLINWARRMRMLTRAAPLIGVGGGAGSGAQG